MEILVRTQEHTLTTQKKAKVIMKIAVLTSGILPVPAVQGGAVENLMDFYLQYNELHHLHDITVYSVWHSDVKKHPALKSEVNHYHFIMMNGWWARLKKKIYQKTHGKEYYHYTIEYFLEQALKHIKKQQYDIIILENRPGYALKLKRHTNAKIVYHLHNDLLNYKSKSAGVLYDAATCIITVSNYITNRVKTIQSEDTKCITVHNGIDSHAFSLKTSHISLLSIKEDDFVIIFSGRLNSEKGIKEIISAMKIIDKSIPIKLLVLGSSFYGNTNHENDFVHHLREMARPIKDRIIFTGYIPYKEMPDYLLSADLAVLPSVWDEPFGLTMAEAQAIGLPIITTKRGGIPEVVSEENAILLNTDEHFIDNLANAILDLYKHPDKRKIMSEASLKRSKLFDKETYAKNFFAALEELGE